MTAPLQDPLKSRQLQDRKPSAPAAEVDAAMPEDLLFAGAAGASPAPGPGPDDSDDDDWAVAAPMPETYPGDAPPLEPLAEPPAGRPHRNPLPPARGASAPALRGEAPTKREPLPPQAQPRTRFPVSTREPAAPWAAPATVLGVGLVAAACFSLLAHNYPVAIFIALLSTVGALLVRLLLQASIE